ncbi:MAG TPA: heavy metal response regulator transcription factor [Armatimonadota bacterium]
MRILIVEDESKTAISLQSGLSEHGFAVDISDHGEIGARLACDGHYDLVILDAMLPGRDGWSIVAEMRHRSNHTPVLFLTARDSVQDRVRGLDLGADDYLTKPFAFTELLARVRCLMRRIPAQEPIVVSIADLHVNLLSQKVTRTGSNIELSQKEFQLLSLLLRHHGEVLSRRLIAAEVWNIPFDCGTNVVDVAIRRLRRRIDEGYSVQLIHTVKGMGYVLEEKC